MIKSIVEMIKKGFGIRDRICAAIILYALLSVIVPVNAGAEENANAYNGFCGTYQQIFVDGKLLYEASNKMFAGSTSWVKYADYFLPRNMADGSYAFENLSTSRRFAAADEGRQIPATIYNIYYDSYSSENFKGLNDNTQHWIREYSDEDGVFYLKNLENGLYLGLSGDGQVISVDESQKAEITFQAHPEESPLCLLSATGAYRELSAEQRSRLRQIYESVAGDIFDRNGAYKNSFLKPMTPRKKIDRIYESVTAGNTEQLNAYLSIGGSDIASTDYKGYLISDKLPGTKNYTATFDQPIETAAADANGYLHTTLTVYNPDETVSQTVSVTVQNDPTAKKNAEYFAQVMPQIPYSYRRVVKKVNIEKSNGDYFDCTFGNTIGIHVPRSYGRDLMMSKIVHELAHGQDIAYGGGYWHWTAGEEWREAAKKDIFTPTEYGHTDYDKWNEDFAEFCHFYFASYTNQDWRRALEILFPNRSRLFREMRYKNIDELSLWEEQLGGAFALTFDPCGGTVTPAAAEAFHGGVYGGLPIPTRAGYCFDGWYTENNEPVTDETKVTETAPQILYAHWTDPNATPSPDPTETPTAAPTPSPTETPSTTPSPTPTPTPSPTPSPTPTPTPSPTPTATPSPTPSPTPTPTPTSTPTPTVEPNPSTPTPTATPKPDKVTVDKEIDMKKVPASSGSPAKVKASIHMYVPEEKGAQETTLILAVFKDNVLQSLKYIKETVTGDKQLEAEIEARDGVTVKAMLWDGKQRSFVQAQRLEF